MIWTTETFRLTLIDLNETWSLNNFVELVQYALRDNWAPKSVLSSILEQLSQICGENK